MIFYQKMFSCILYITLVDVMVSIMVLCQCVRLFGHPVIVFVYEVKKDEGHNSWYSTYKHGYLFAAPL